MCKETALNRVGFLALLERAMALLSRPLVVLSALLYAAAFRPPPTWPSGLVRATAVARHAIVMQGPADDAAPRVLVFGAAGTCGRAVCESLCAREGPSAPRVFAFVRDAAKVQLPDAVEVIHGDMGDAVAMAEAFSASNARLVFLACSNGPQQAGADTNVREGGV